MIDLNFTFYGFENRIYHFKKIIVISNPCNNNKYLLTIYSNISGLKFRYP